MFYFALGLSLLTMIAFVLGVRGFAGLSAEIGWLFAVLALTFMVVAVRLSDSSGWHPVLEAEAAERSFGPFIEMRLTPAAATAAGAPPAAATTTTPGNAGE